MLQEKSLKNSNDDTVASACQKALAESSKALKAFSFYPEGHPLRRQIVDSAYRAVADLAGRGKVTFVVQRGGFSLPEDDAAIENNPVTRALALELFTRELQRVTFLPEISPTEFSGFLSLLTVSPQKIAEDGGMAQLLARSGIRSVVVNQIDISAVYTRKSMGETVEAPADGADPRNEAEAGSAPAQRSRARAPELSIEEILAAMSTAGDEESYRKLAAILLDKAQPLKQERRFDYLFKVVMALVEQSAVESRSAASRGCARTVVQQLCLGTMLEHLLDHLEDPEFGDRESIYRILELMGPEAVDAVTTRFFAAGSKPSRKSFAIATVRIGAPALPHLLNALKDRRWQVVYAALQILGEMGNRGAVKGLALTLHHPDTRVRMETVRVLAKISGMEATSLLLSLLDDEDQAVALHAIAWLGQSRNQMALQPLLQLVKKRDLLGQSHPLKKEALIAIGRIGDRGSLDPLFRVVRKRFWLAPGRGTELRLAAVAAIGAVGGEQARNFLKNLATKDGELGRAAGAALEAFEQRVEEHG